MAPVISFLTIGLLAVHSAVAHPGHNLADEVAEQKEFVKRDPKTFRPCAATLESSGHSAAAIRRRSRFARDVRSKRSVSATKPLRRDFAEYNVSHASYAEYGQDETMLFADDSSCLLSPETTFGSYYVDGELIRQNIS